MDVELHRHSLGEEYLFSQSSESDLSDVPTSLPLPLSIPAPVKASSPIKQLRDSSPDASADKGKANGYWCDWNSWNGFWVLSLNCSFGLKVDTSSLLTADNYFLTVLGNII